VEARGARCDERINFCFVSDGRGVECLLRVRSCRRRRQLLVSGTVAAALEHFAATFAKGKWDFVSLRTASPALRVHSSLASSGRTRPFLTFLPRARLLHAYMCALEAPKTPINGFYKTGV
jgi:hypothetical protein